MATCPDDRNGHMEARRHEGNSIAGQTPTLGEGSCGWRESSRIILWMLLDTAKTGECETRTMWLASACTATGGLHARGRG